MGIPALLKHVSPACQSMFVHSFAGKVLGVDISCLIYKGLYNNDYIQYIRCYIDLFARLHIKAILVFDGKPPDEKKEALAKRMDNVVKYGQQKVSEEMTDRVKEVFSDYPHVTIIQAPGEADAQLAYFETNGLVDAVVTDDSDLIVYGCQRIIFKLMPFGKCIYYDRAKLKLEFDFEVFRWICIMAGCDYFPGGARNYGLIKATSFMRKTKP